MKLTLFQTSSLNKTFLDSPTPPLELKNLSCLKGEEVSYQLVCRVEEYDDLKLVWKVKVDSPLSQYITVREIGQVPSELPAYLNLPNGYDDDYLTLKPGLFPDPLYPLVNDTVELIPNYYRALWVSIQVPKTLAAGKYPISITLTERDSGLAESTEFELEVIDAVLPEQELIVTQWFHSDCIASYYKIKPLSPKHWQWLDKFIKTAADNGINMLLTPIFTPPLDTEVGRERPTVQLVDIAYENGQYSFGFSKLKRWIRMCKKNGIKYFEMAHLFTQWGAKFTPKIVVKENGVEVKKFGWHVAADSEEYVEFLQQFLPALTAFLKAEGVAENTVFHISDEPHAPDREQYRKVRNIVKPLIEGFRVLDASSDYPLYEEGLIDTPAASITKIGPYLANKVKPLWAYYCCSQFSKVSNRFFAMPSYRNRIIGLQLYKYQIEGFLQWGYNFYYSQLSRSVIDPFATTDAKNAFPSGDAFSVYPGEKDVIEALRLKVFKEALQDMRALRLLEMYMPHDEIVRMIEEYTSCELRFDSYPKGEELLLGLREKINALIKANVMAKGE